VRFSVAERKVARDGKEEALFVRFVRERRRKMGFTRYWYREPEISEGTMRMIVDDSGKIVLPLDDHGVHLAGPIGEGAPEISIEKVAFNGLTSCGHAKNTKVVISWPTPDAAGLSSGRALIVGEHAGGVFIDSRRCNGSCRYETFLLERVAPPAVWERSMADFDGRSYRCCKTAFRPYDIAVCAVLLIAKRHLGPRISVRTDGEDAQWFDAKMLCQTVLGYGIEYAVTDGELLSVDPGTCRLGWSMTGE
jgi:hypothetical protein